LRKQQQKDAISRTWAQKSEMRTQKNKCRKIRKCHYSAILKTHVRSVEWCFLTDNKKENKSWLWLTSFLAVSLPKWTCISWGVAGGQTWVHSRLAALSRVGRKGPRALKSWRAYQRPPAERGLSEEQTPTGFSGSLLRWGGIVKITLALDGHLLYWDGSSIENNFLKEPKVKGT
jgi:hypothetical protein